MAGRKPGYPQRLVKSLSLCGRSWPRWFRQSTLTSPMLVHVSGFSGALGATLRCVSAFHAALHRDASGGGVEPLCLARRLRIRTACWDISRTTNGPDAFRYSAAYGSDSLSLPIPPPPLSNDPYDPDSGEGYECLPGGHAVPRAFAMAARAFSSAARVIAFWCV